MGFINIFLNAIETCKAHLLTCSCLVLRAASADRLTFAIHLTIWMWEMPPAHPANMRSLQDCLCWIQWCWILHSLLQILLIFLCLLVEGFNVCEPASALFTFSYFLSFTLSIGAHEVEKCWSHFWAERVSLCYNVMATSWSPLAKTVCYCCDISKILGVSSPLFN